MAFQSTTERVIRLIGPTKGVSTRSAQTKLTNGEFSMLRNHELVEDVGIWSLRRGTAAVHPISLGSTPIRGGIRWYYGSVTISETVFGHGTQLYRLVAGVPVSIATGFDNDKEWHFAPFTDFLYATNATNAVRRWDGTAMRTAGFPVPLTAPTAAIGAAGVLTGTYTYKVTFVYDGNTSAESAASAASNAVAPVAQQVNLSLIPIGAVGAGVTARKLYRTKAGGSLYFELATIGDNTTTTFVDNTSDALLGLSQAPADNGVPPLGQFILVNRGRMYIARTNAKPGRLFFSAISSTERAPAGTLSIHGANVEIFPSDHFIDIGDDNTPITGLAVWGDSLVIFKEHEIYMLRGDTASDLSVWNTGNRVGCIAPRSIVNLGLEYGIFFLGRGETTPTVYRFTGGRCDPVSDRVEATLRANVIGTTDSFTVKPNAGSYRGQYVLCYAIAAGTPPTYEIAKYDTRLNRWSFDRNVRASCWIPHIGPNDAGEMVFGDATGGWLVFWDRNESGDFDDTDPGDSVDPQLFIETQWMDLGTPYQIKQLKWIYVIAEVQTNATIKVERRYNFKTTGTTSGAAAQAMTATITGANIFVFRPEAEYEGGATEVEAGYFCKVLITVDQPAIRADPFRPVRIHDIVLVFEEQPPTDHYQ